MLKKAVEKAEVPQYASTTASTASGGQRAFGEMYSVVTLVPLIVAGFKKQQLRPGVSALRYHPAPQKASMTITK